MKKLYSLILAIAMLLSCLAAASCRDGSPEDSSGSTQNPAASESVEDAPDVVIAENGDDIYSLIRYIDAPGDEVELVLNFKNDLNAKYKMSFAISTDWTSPALAPPPDAPEIIIGLTCREETGKLIEKHNLGYGDCAIEIFENNKIVMVAPNFADLSRCFEYFLNNLETVNSESGAQQIVYTGGNYVSKSGEAHLWDASGGLPEFKIVYGKDGNNKKHAESVAKSFKKQYGIEYQVICETEPKTGYEIIVGVISDMTRVDYNFSLLNPLGYDILVSEDSILLAASTETTMNNVVEKFLSSFVRTGNVVTTNLPVGMRLSYDTFAGGDSDVLADGADTRIMSFNILSEEWDSAAVLAGRDVRVSATILNYHPDVAALQEVSNKWYPILENYIGNVYKFTRKTTPSGKGTYTTLIYNTETTKLIEEDIYLYSVGNSDRLRSIAWGLFESKVTGEQYIVFSTHWDVGAERQPNRVKQAKEMANLAKSLGDKYKVDVYVCGDYNASESTEEYKNFLKDAGYVDAKTDAKVKNRACKTYHTLFSNLDTSVYESIDHITFSKDIASKVLFYNTLINDYVIDASDHCPIYIDIVTKK
jgi:endonuclease/exonuclease/phosphatase family metal-dependent hydrolase